VQPSDWIRQVNAQLRYYLHINPDELTDEQWAYAWKDLEWIREQEAKANK